MKHWRLRHQLFTRFDEGVRYDKEGFESAKSEGVANFVAAHLPGKTILDAFSGIGGSAIAFARAGKRVISIELNPERSEMAQANARLYGVHKKITFVVGDTTELLLNLRYDAVYFDPPWGGVGYERYRTRRFDSFRPNVLPLLKAVRARSKHVAVTVPFNFDLNELKKMPTAARLYFNKQFGKHYCIHALWLQGDT